MKDDRRSGKIAKNTPTININHVMIKMKRLEQSHSVNGHLQHYLRNNGHFHGTRSLKLRFSELLRDRFKQSCFNKIIKRVFTLTAIVS